MNFKKSIVILGLLLIFISCATNPFTGKKTMAFVSNAQLFPSSFAQYNQVKSENKIITDAEFKKNSFRNEIFQ